ncbi:hypothetical protein F4559_006436 [Saccharothrix violaceirubra]|uniref:Uncharacterized protein n=1 Tax=Saccharothrix violaceirubra TaxID=413306 RepID=A0A7W7WZ99_9PSEU|nr:hypothetical protein [Saccharothrix violaceirubra]
MIDDQLPVEIFEDDAAPIPVEISAFASTEDKSPQNHMSNQEVN